MVPINITLNLEDYGQLLIVAGNWQQLDMPAGMRITASNTTPIYIYGKATDDYEIDEGGILSAVNDVYTYTHIAANGTFNIKSSAGALHTATINNPGASWTLTVYDNTSATAPIVAVITPVAGLIITLEYDVHLNNGLTIVAAGTTPGDVTIASR